MKKIIKLEIENTTRIRSTENTYCEIYSHDKNNGYFEFEIMNEYLTVERPMAVFKFMESRKVWKTEGVLDKNKIKVTFDTDLITQEETVVCFLYLDEDQRTSDVHRFKFKVNLSEIDKLHTYETKERFVKDTIIVDRTDVVTKEDLQEALKNIETGNISTLGLLTEVKAEELYAKKSDAVDNTNFELVKNRVLALELKTDKDTVYDDSEVKERLTTLENKAPVDLSGYATKEELRNISGSQPTVDNLVTKEELEAKHYISDVSNLATKEELNEVRNSQPTVDTSHLVTRDELTAKNYLTEHQPLDNLVTKQELEEKQYLTTHQDLSEYAKKSELYNDSDLKARVEVLEQKTDKDTVYDDTPLKERVTALESKAIEGGAYDDTHLRERLDVLEAKHDNDIIYDDTEVKRRLTEIESKPVVDTSVFITDEKLNSKGYLTSHQDLSNYALKSEIPQPYNDSPLNERVKALESKAIEGGGYDDSDLRNRVVALESKEDKDTKYDDTDLKNRVTTLENKPPLDTSEFVTNQVLESKGYIKDVSNLVTKDELANKGYLTQHQSLDHVVTKDELASKNYLTEHQPLTEVNNRLNVLEAKQDKDTVYNDEPIKERLIALENKPNVDLSNYVTSEQLENKHYLTQHQPLDNLVTKEELNSKGYVTDEVLNSKGYLTEELLNRKNYLTEDVLNTKNYLTQHQDLSSLVTKQELENKHYLTEHQPLTHLATTSDLEALRNIAVSKSELNNKLDTTEFNTFKDNVVTKSELAEKRYISDLSNYVTKEELHEATEIDYSNIVTTDELEPYAKKSELPTPYNDSALVSRINVLEAKTDKDTVYNDTEVKQRLTALENRPTTGGGLSTEDVATYTNNIIYVPNGNIVYDKNLKKLYIPKCNVKVGKTNYWCEAQEVTINGSAGFIVFNKAQKRIVGGDVNTTNDVLLGYYDNNIGNYFLNTFSKAFKKKKIACLGDSITEGVNANGWQWHRYIDKYFKENGVETTIVNLGIGGTSVCTSSHVTASLQPFVNRLNTIPTDTDVIVIFGGTNDWGNNATLGTISDTGNSSFYGAYKYMLEWLAINRPNAKILTITPLKRYFRGNTTTWINAQTTRNTKGQLLQDYVRAVKEVSEMYAIPCVDLHNESGLNPVLEIVRTKYMGDGLHPTAEGNKKMYPIILNKLKPLVKYD